ncbi:IS630 family transposase [Flexibacterium corallicola]|uniref:IS630 family transposase n=1 Tax=Flexibacterium corallicola TaxID=3037259 RepID=UPI00286EBA4A|nr:IS630 family transposase [Pseudovibrio sp. M1P-2-3]
MSAIPLRRDYDASSLRTLACQSKDVRQSRRLLALAAVYDGLSRLEAARMGGMDRQTLRDWVHRFNAEGPHGLYNRKSPGRVRWLNKEQMAEFADLVEAGPDLQQHGVIRWRRRDLQGVIEQKFGVSYSERAISSLLRVLGFSRVSVRPQHPAQDEQVMETYKKNFHARLKEIKARLPSQTSMEIWWQDEARIGQKNGLTRRWAKKGTRPRAPSDGRYQSTYVFGAICPAHGKGAALVLPKANTNSMQLHLKEISRTVAKGAHAVVLMDQAGWHTTAKLKLPDNITILLLPPRSPELNPVENVWQYLRQNWLSNRTFQDYQEIVDAACSAWNKLIQQPHTITSIGRRNWAHTGQL